MANPSDSSTTLGSFTQVRSTMSSENLRRRR